LLTYREKILREYRTIAYYFGKLIIGIGVVQLIPIPMLMFQTSTFLDFIAFIAPAALAIIGGYAIVKYTINGATAFSMKSGAVVVTLTWVVAVILGAIPFVVTGQLTWLDAIFEAMSGWTTTGLSMVDVSQTSPVFLFWRSLMQFVGGAGLAVLMLSAVVGPEANGLYEAEARSDRFVPNVIDTSRILLKLYLTYFGVGAVLYMLSGMTWFDAINHSMAVLSTGGFSTRGESIGYWNSISVETVTLVLMILGTTNFSTHYVLLTQRRIKTLMDNEVVAFFVLMGITVPLILYALVNTVYQGVGHTFRIALFQAISALSTTGFQTVPFTHWTETAVLLIIILMIIGGGTGATAGGLKLYRISLAFKTVYWSIKSKLFPRTAIIRHTLNKQGEEVVISHEHLLEVAFYIFIYLMTYLAGVLVLMFSGFSLRDSLFEFASSLGTVGLSVGITGPDMPAAAKVAEILGMWLGRLEFTAIIVAISKLVKDCWQSLRS